MGPFKDDLKRYLVDNSSARGHQLPLVNLWEVVCDFSFFPKGVKVVDPEPDDDIEQEEGKHEGAMPGRGTIRRLTNKLKLGFPYWLTLNN